MRVYHFLCAKWALENLSNQRLKKARIQELNDPFELLATDLSDKKRRKGFRSWKRQMEQSFGVLCFSRTKRNPVLWSHYADKHKGICLGFDVRKSTIMEVNYVKERQGFNSDTDLTQATMKKLLSTKYEGWSYEDEIRVFTHLKDKDEKTGLYFAEFGDDIKLKEVLVGPLCKVTKKEIMGELRGYLKPVQVIKTRLAFKSFSVVKNLQGFRRG